MCKCSESFENKFVQCFDQQEIAMYMKSNGVIKLVHGNVVEMTNINFCPYCGRLLKISDIRPIDSGAGAIDSGAGAIATAEIMNPILQENTIINDIQKVINESILNSVKRDASGKLNLSENFIKGGSM